MPEYIERGAALKEVDQSYGLYEASLRVSGIPTADVAPVRHGKWVIDDDNTRECHCSECRWPAPRDAYGYHREQTRYCVYCGALMDL